MTTTVTVHDPDRAAGFEHVFGTSTVPVLNFIAQEAMLPGFSTPQLVHLIDLTWVREQGRWDALVDHLVARFGRPRAEVETDLVTAGMPILADGCSARTDRPEFL